MSWCLFWCNFFCSNMFLFPPLTKLWLQLKRSTIYQVSDRGCESVHSFSIQQIKCCFLHWVVHFWRLRWENCQFEPRFDVMCDLSPSTHIFNSCLFRLSMDDLFLPSRGFFMKWSFLNAFLARLLAMIWRISDKLDVIWVEMEWNDGMDSRFLLNYITKNSMFFLKKSGFFGLKFQMSMQEKDGPSKKLAWVNFQCIFQWELDCNLL